jgi:ribosome maturation factor RimP
MAQRGRSAAGTRQGARSGAPRGGTPQAGAGRAAAPPRPAPPEPPTLRPQELAALRDRLRQLVAPIVEGQHLDLEDLSVVRAGRRYVVRITVDGDGGVGHNELTAVSRAISDGLDEAEEAGRAATPEAYTLEVSSPGVDMSLTLPRHWARRVGRLIKVKAGERQVTGRIVAVTGTTVELDLNGRPQEFALTDLGPGHVQVEFTRLAELTDDELGDLTDDEDDADEGDAEEGDAADGDVADDDEELEDEA